MEEVKYITIAGYDFVITKELDINDNHYMLAIDENKGDTISILKKVIVDGKELVESVKDDDELELVLEMFKR